MIKASILRISGLGMLIGVAALTLVSCSEVPTEKFQGEVSLVIDQKAVISEKLSNPEALEKHTGLLDVFETACQVAYFFETKFRARQALEEGSVLQTGAEDLAQVALKEIYLTDVVLTCGSGRLADDFPYCRISEGGTQKQYLLALRDFLTNGKKMEESAVLKLISKSSIDGRSLEVTKLYTVKGNTLNCSDAMVETGS